MVLICGSTTFRGEHFPPRLSSLSSGRRLPFDIRRPPSAVRHPPSAAIFRHPSDRRYLPFLSSAVVSSSYDLRARLSLAIFSFSVLAFSLVAIPRESAFDRLDLSEQAKEVYVIPPFRRLRTFLSDSLYPYHPSLLRRPVKHSPSPGARQGFYVKSLRFPLMSGEGILPCNQKRPPVIAPPSSAASPSSPNHHSHHDKVRTIFISGLPTDVKERELQNLLRWLPGFEASQVSFKGKEPKGFALFSTAKFAVAAKDTLQEMVFDAKLKSLLHIEMAKKNLLLERLQVFMCMINLGVMLKSLPQLLSKMDGSGESTTKDCINDKSGCFTNSKGFRFGFIRFASFEEARRTISKINGSRIDGSKIGVFFAKFKPRHSYWRKSSTSILRKSWMEDVSSKNHYKVEGVIDEEKLQVLSNCLVGWCKDFVKIGHLARQMQSKGLTGFTLMRAAGNAILMIFEDNASLRSVKNDKSKILAEWFSIVEAWSESLVMECRRVWLVCEGVPFHAWNWNTFKNIADKWGLLLAIDESCQSPSSFDRAKIQVLTKADARIDSMVELKVGDNFFKVMVHEIEPSFKPNSWAPEEYKSH
ncbi:Detected protein of unknown function [Hibiscus syriacus]|uniref:RRM domain-containing protein n=1 Tax=Hibiscus syriacus TaxID=106335 RepID=A0A6A2WMU9_HIBSY|nr:Detected protein of unknown function [Hibiscus syriacus]